MNCTCGKPVAPRNGTRGKQPSTCLDCRRPARSHSREEAARVMTLDKARRLVQSAKDGDTLAIAQEFGRSALGTARRALRRAGVPG